MVIGTERDDTNKFVNFISRLILLRNIKEFGVAFNTQKEHLAYFFQEIKDIDSPRYCFVSLCETTLSSLRVLNNFKSFILGVEDKIKKEAFTLINKKFSSYLHLNLKSKKASIKLVGLDNPKNISFERELTEGLFGQKISILLEEIKKIVLNFPVLGFFKEMDFSSNKERDEAILSAGGFEMVDESTRRSLFNSQIHNFMLAAKRIYLYLNKVIEANQIERRVKGAQWKPLKISDKTLNEAVELPSFISIERLIPFIQEEYLGFQEIIEGWEKIDLAELVGFKAVDRISDALGFYLENCNAGNSLKRTNNSYSCDSKSTKFFFL